MKERNLRISYREYASADELPEADRALLEVARAQWANAYAPYSHFLVGAALRLEDDTLLGGSNQENAAYPMCLCAERVALAAAASAQAGKKVKVLAVVCRHRHRTLDRPGTPCGACRQFISETEDRQQAPIQILLAGEEGPIWRFDRGKDLLPLAFSGDLL